MRAYIVALALLGIVQTATARDVHVDGYFRSNGTYVAPHVRSSPDSDRSNNYGASSSGSGYSGYGGTATYTRDSDHDGVSNQYDYDDNNNGIGDNYDN